MDINYTPPKEAYIEFVKNDFHNSPIKKVKLNTNGQTGASIVETDNSIHFDESLSLSNKSVLDIVANTSQRDYLNETVNDKYRCGASSLLNSYLLLGGDFSSITKKFDLDNNINFKNIHLIQDKLYSYANVDNREGLESSYIYSYDRAGNIKKVFSQGEMFKAASKIGLSIKPLIGNTLKTINDKRESVNNFLDTKKGVLVVSVYLDTKTGEIKSVSEKSNNHYVTVFKNNDSFFMADTGRKSNGQKNNLIKLDNQQLDNLVFNNPSVINGIFFNN